MQQAMKSRVGLQTYDVSIVLFSFWDTLTELSSSGPPQYVVTPYFFYCQDATAYDERACSCRTRWRRAADAATQ